MDAFGVLDLGAAAAVALVAGFEVEETAVALDAVETGCRAGVTAPLPLGVPSSPAITVRSFA